MRPAFVSIALSILLCPSSLIAAPSLNLSQALADTKSVLAGGEEANIVVFGDSLSFREGSYLYPFREKLQSHYGNAGTGWQGFSTWTGGEYNHGWTVGQINNDTAPFRSLDGLWASSSSPPYPPNHTNARFDAESEHVEVHYVAGPGAGSFRVNRPDGSLVTTINTSAAVDEVRTFSHAFAAGENRLWYQPLGDGPATILGQDNTAAASGVKVHRAANGGWGVDNFLQRDWTFDQQLNIIDPDLFLVWIGANDAQYTGMQFEAKLHQLVDRLVDTSPSAEIVLVGGFNLGYAGFENRVGAMEDVARERRLGFISMLEAGGAYESIVASGWLDPDGIHFSPSGGEHFGQLMYDAFITDGASLVPEPTTTWLIGGAMLLLARRRRQAVSTMRSGTCGVLRSLNSRAL